MTMHVFAFAATLIQPYVNRSELKIEGFMVHRWADRWLEGIQQNMAWIKEVSLFEALCASGNFLLYILLYTT